MLIRRIIFIQLMLSVATVVQAKVYYVKTTGNDNNSGLSDAQAWATWQKAFDSAEAGDTVYFREGIWYPTEATYGQTSVYLSPTVAPIHGHNGEAGKPICFFNYPGEKPILDGSLYDATDNYLNGIGLAYAHYIHFRGLTIRNFWQRTDTIEVRGIGSAGGSNHTFENISVHDIGGGAIRWFGQFGYDPEVDSDTVRFINCDMYNCADTLDDDPGNSADGIKADNEGGAYFEVSGCRAWNCSDDGFDFSGPAVVSFNRCWSFSNGYLSSGNGAGFKYGAIRYYVPVPTRIVTHCLSAYNSSDGFYDLEYEPYYRNNSRIYNNTSYKNYYGFRASTNEDRETRNSIYRNNISYDNFLDVAIYQVPYEESNNTWDAYDPRPGSSPWFVTTDTVTVTDEDFISINQDELFWPRKPDNSLPDIDFLKLAAGSDLIDAGADIGLPYHGNAPDIGFNEYLIPVTAILVTGAGGLATINTDNGTLQLSAIITPSDASDKTVTWTLSNSTGQATINSTGLVTAVADGIVIAKATANDGSGIYGQLQITISNQAFIPVNNITITGEGGLTTINTDDGLLQLIAVISPVNAENKTVTWSMVNGTGQAQINSTGLVKAVSNGTVTAKAMANDGSGVYGQLQITISNQIIPVTSISVSGTDGISNITTDNGTLQLIATIVPNNATNLNVTWSLFNNSGEAQISATGLVTAFSDGTVTARALANDGSGVSGTMTITISNQILLITGITILSANGDSVISENKGTLQLFKVVSPLDASDTSVIWSIQNETGNASISEAGLVTAIANGIVKAAALASDGSGVSDTFNITILNQNSTDLPDLENEVARIQYNQSLLTIHIPEKDLFHRLYIYSSFGKLLYSINLEEGDYEFDLSMMIPGIYFIVLSGNENIKTSKVSIY